MMMGFPAGILNLLLLLVVSVCVCVDADERPEEKNMMRKGRFLVLLEWVSADEFSRFCTGKNCTSFDRGYNQSKPK